jgi:hypothetical protein
MRLVGALAAAALLAATTGASTAQAAGSTVNVDYRANGRTITLHQGQTLHVVLYNTYWTLNDPSGWSLKATGPESLTPGPHVKGCYGSQGCGKVSRSYLAKWTGSGAVTAHRDTCGEALHCSPEQSDYSVSVRIVP